MLFLNERLPHIARIEYTENRKELVNIMVNEYKLWDSMPGFDPSYGQPETTITYYPADDAIRPCVIVFPGGGYEMRASHEGVTIAERYNREGFHAFVVNYRLRPYRYPEILFDGKRAVRYVRYYAEKFKVEPDHIAVCGFSAGGNLAVLTSEQYDAGIEDGDEIDRVSSRPDAAILCYSVSTLTEFTHGGTRDHLLRDYENRDELIKKLSGELAVRDDNPPTFIWHTASDDCVPVENALLMAQALQNKRIPMELHVYPFGNHGVGLGDGVYNCNTWMPLSVSFLHLMFQ